MKTNVNIRKYTSNDRASVLNLLRLNTPLYFAITEEADLVYYLNNHAADYYVIEFENIIAGCGGINFLDDYSIGVISWDIIHPDYQGKGFGKSLTSFRIDELKKIDSIKKIIVRTSQLTFPFYEKSGFKLVEIKKDYWALGYDLYRMEIQL